MKKNFCCIPCTPVRFEKTDCSEMVSQVLFGESFEIIEKANNWVKISMEDGYIGWIDNRVIEQREVEQDQICFVNKLWTEVSKEGNKIIVPYGSELQADKDEFSIHDFCFNKKNSIEKIISDAEIFLNTPYLWGGRSSFGIDCSGLIQIVAKTNGYKLPRDASDQAKIGLPVSYENRRLGDVVFFKNDLSKIIHVGVLTQKNEIIHSSAWVRKDKFDEKGIFDGFQSKYSHVFSHIMRIFE